MAGWRAESMAGDRSGMANSVAAAKHNLKETPIVTSGPYQYSAEEDEQLKVANI
jgi:hypothetical protein